MSEIDKLARTVEVDEQQNFEVCHQKAFVGALNLHYPKRSWDARLALQVAEGVDDRLGDMVDEIVRNLKISTGEKDRALVLSTLTADPNTPAITSVQVCRETCHRTTMNPDCQLQLRELNDLAITSCLEAEGVMYRGEVSNAAADIINDARSWWEASISSSYMQSKLKENETLEIGGRSLWTPKEVIDAGIVRNLKNLAEDVVPRIDIVGQHNRGPRMAQRGSAPSISSRRGPPSSIPNLQTAVQSNIHGLESVRESSWDMDELEYW